AVDVLEHLRRLRPRLLLALLLALVAGGATYVVSNAQAPVYEATLTAYVDTGAPAGSAADAAIRTEWTEGAVAMTAGVLDDVVDEAGVDWSTGDATDRTSVARDPDSGELLVRVLGPSRDAAARVADELVVVLDRRLAAQQRRTVTAVVRPLQEQAADIEDRLAALPAGGTGRSGLQADLDAVLQQITDARDDEAAATLQALGPAVAAEEPIAPKPVGTAVTIALVVLVLAAECLMLLRRRRRPAPPAQPGPGGRAGAPDTRGAGA
ncbi:hypothetical protein, partial [Modestobacter versicolor]|uniref:hypothetical protein n=1 Tax=Modestobacter versicolor TaxID=429133 RepID=UPI0034E034C0